jgi:hypothetical protein
LIVFVTGSDGGADVRADDCRTQPGHVITGLYMVLWS